MRRCSTARPWTSSTAPSRCDGIASRSLLVGVALLVPLVVAVLVVAGHRSDPAVQPAATTTAAVETASAPRPGRRHLAARGHRHRRRHVSGSAGPAVRQRRHVVGIRRLQRPRRHVACVGGRSVRRHHGPSDPDRLQQRGVRRDPRRRRARRGRRRSNDRPRSGLARKGDARSRPSRTAGPARSRLAPGLLVLPGRSGRHRPEADRPVRSAPARRQRSGGVRRPHGTAGRVVPGRRPDTTTS